MSNTNHATQDTTDRAERYARAAALLRQWLADADKEDESDYDWPAIDREMGDAAMRCREPANESEDR